MVWVRVGTSRHSLLVWLLSVAAIAVNAENRLIAGQTWTTECPNECRLCDIDELGRKRVVCDAGGLSLIPVDSMDKKANILNFTAPPDRPNQVTIGRLFMKFNELQEVYITHSNVPAIGESTFYPGWKMQVLDLSFNNLTIILDSDFKYLKNLVILNLSDNNLEALPSATFRFLHNLTRLSLSRNKLTRLVPRLFYRLDKLETLDLSGNPLLEIEPEDSKDLRPLRRLYLKGCQLSKLHSLIYQSLPNLEELDLRDNRFEAIGSSEFKYLKKLKNLHLDGNRLKLIAEKTFAGLALTKLGLSHNLIIALMSCAFCNSTIKELDISHNNLTAIHTDLVEPLSTSLIYLNAQNNFDLKDAATSVPNLIRPLRSIRRLVLSSMNLEDSLPYNVFLNQRETLSSIDLSGNKFVNISAKLFEGLKRLESLDLSSNLMFGLSDTMLETLSSLTSLTVIYLDSNPWSCFRCHILPLMDWIKASDAYKNACENDQRKSCAKCVHPLHLTGKELHLMEEWSLEWCADPTIQLRMSTTEPNVGLVLALLIIISLIIVIIAVIVLYRKQGATYYTHEDELRFDDKTVFSVSDAVQRFANATRTPPLSPDSPTPSTRSSVSVSSQTTHTKATENSPHSSGSQPSLPATPSPVNSSASHSSATQSSPAPSSPAISSPAVSSHRSSTTRPKVV